MTALVLSLFTAVLALGQTAAVLPQQLLSQPGPTFSIEDSALHSPLTFIAYGDQRFTDPANVSATNPRVRRWLVERIAQEMPDAVVLNGDVPLAGRVKHDYEVFHDETRPWRDAHLRVFPALGNHELHGDPAECLENWWAAFPEVRNRRWYSAQIGSRLYVIALDSDTDLTPGSDQARWLSQQMNALPASISLVLITMHHPPVADVQTRSEVNHNPRPNEIALRYYLTEVAKRAHARIVVSAGHIHNYERHLVGNVVYLVSGGGGARPLPVQRTPDDLYHGSEFPNYHFVKFTLEKDRVRGQMFRVLDPEAKVLAVEVKDQFDVLLEPPVRPTIVTRRVGSNLYGLRRLGIAVCSRSLLKAPGTLADARAQ